MSSPPSPVGTCSACEQVARGETQTFMHSLYVLMSLVKQMLTQVYRAPAVPPREENQAETAHSLLQGSVVCLLFKVFSSFFSSQSPAWSLPLIPLWNSLCCSQGEHSFMQNTHRRGVLPTVSESVRESLLGFPVENLRCVPGGIQRSFLSLDLLVLT